MAFTDQLLICRDCNQDFRFTAGEQQFFADKGLANLPKRCKACKSKINQRTQIPLTQVHCSACGVETTVPFVPTQGRPVFCGPCFAARKSRAQAVSA